MRDTTPAPYGEITRRWTRLSLHDRNRHAARLVGVDLAHARIDRPDAGGVHYARLVEGALADDELAFAWLATTHRPLLIARGRPLYLDDSSEWGAVALEVLHTTLRRIDLGHGRWLRSAVARRLSARMHVHVHRHVARRRVELPTDPATLLRRGDAVVDDRDGHVELSAVIAEVCARLDGPTRAGLCALAESQSLTGVAAAHELSHAALRQRVTRAKARLRPELAGFVRTPR